MKDDQWKADWKGEEKNSKKERSVCVGEIPLFSKRQKD